MLMKEITVCGYAKINLHLDIVGRLENGYHAVETVMQAVSLCDDVTLILRERGEIIACCDRDGVPTDERNLAVRAALLFRERLGEDFGLRISINKRIPMAAGMAGGSADAAATLLGLNRLFGERLDGETLCSLGARLGADVPFCMAGGTSFADGIGDSLHGFPSLPDCYLVTACDGEGVSTPWVYGLLDRVYSDFEKAGPHVPRGVEPLRDAMRSGILSDIAERMYNIFEEPVLAERPAAARLRDLLLELGALGAMMSGSGPSVFGIFATQSAAERAVECLSRYGIHADLCRPVTKINE